MYYGYDKTVVKHILRDIKIFIDQREKRHEQKKLLNEQFFLTKTCSNEYIFKFLLINKNGFIKFKIIQKTKSI